MHVWPAERPGDTTSGSVLARALRSDLEKKNEAGWDAAECTSAQARTEHIFSPIRGACARVMERASAADALVTGRRVLSGRGWAMRGAELAYEGGNTDEGGDR